MSQWLKLAGCTLVLLLLVSAGWAGYERLLTRHVISVDAVVQECSVHPTSTKTTWVHGYLVLPVGIARVGFHEHTVVVGSLWSSRQAARGTRGTQVGEAINLIGHPGGGVTRTTIHLRHQGQGQYVTLHGHISCRPRGPGIEVDGVSAD